MTRLPDGKTPQHCRGKAPPELPSAYFISDCSLISDDGVETLTGEQMYPANLDCKTEAGAAKKLRGFGFKTVGDRFAAKFSWISPIMAPQGDISVVEQGGWFATAFTSIGFTW